MRGILPLLISYSAPDVDYEVRWCLLKLADILIRPVEEVPPSVKIHIPSTPITDVAPQIPPVKVPAKPTRTTKPGGPPSRHPTVQLNVPAAKTGIPGSPHPTPAEQPLSLPVIKKGVLLASPVPPVPPTTTSSKPKMKHNSKLLSSKASNKPLAKPTQTLKAQSAGMTINDLRACRNALKKLQSNRHALLFNQPVDPIRDSAPRYVDRPPR
jgi:transcription initiation factor TFIID subunit 2